MTARQLLTALAAHPAQVALALAVAPVLALVLGFFHGRGGGGVSPWKYLYSLLVYLACVPGMLAAVLVAYTLFFTPENLLDQDLLIHGLPILAMGLTLGLIRRQADFRVLPGFDRLSGLMVLLAVTFALVLAISRTRIWLVFGGSIAYLAALAAGLFALGKWGAHAAFRGAGEARREPPTLPRP